MQQWTEQGLQCGYQRPNLRKLTLQQAKEVLLSQVKEFLELFRRDPPPTVSEEVPELYQNPTLKRLTPEQARMLIVGHASVGDQGAKDLMEVLFPDETPCS